MNFIHLRKFAHHREFAENFSERFRVARTRRRFTVVLGKFQRVREQERIQPRGRARSTISRGNPREAFLFFPQVQLRKKVFVVEGRRGDALAEIGDGFRHRSHARFVFWR